jgi:hypothetical protein
LDESNSLFAPKNPLSYLVYVHTHSPLTIAKVIGIPTYSKPSVYPVAFQDGSIAEYTDELLSMTPTSQSSVTSLLLSWVKGGCNTTLFLSDMPKPCHGALRFTADKKWLFQPDKTLEDHHGILLPDLEANSQTLLDTGKLFCGHTKFKYVFDTENQISLQTSVLCHVSAHGLQ